MSESAETPEEWFHNVEDIQTAPLPPADWTAGEHVVVECSECSHEWLYSGHTPYAQCKCGKSNKVLEVPYE